MTATLHLPEVLDIRAAAPLATKLLGLRGQHLMIDASQVQRVGAQCLQVLLSARATWTADGAPLSLASPSDTFIEALNTLGIPVTRFCEQDTSK